MSKSLVQLYCDGGSRPTDGKWYGGWGVVIVYPSGQVAQHCGYLGESTNNASELNALIAGLQRIDPSQAVEVLADSRYVIDGFARGWIANWKKNGWKTAKKEPVANKDLWLKADEIVRGRKITWTWVKAHAGNEYNELADSLATTAIRDGRAREKDEAAIS